MQTLKGKVNEAVVFADDVEQTAVEQIHRFLDHEAFAGVRIRIMPDVHAGAGAVIGFTAELGDKVIPNVVGVDLGCGLTAWKLPEDVGRIHFDRFDKFVRANIPSGFDVRQERYDGDLPRLLASTGIGCAFDVFEAGVGYIVQRLLESKTLAQRDVFLDRVWKAIGSLGGGNHFIELDRADDGSIWLVVHTGSRNFGLQIAGYHQKIAIAQHGKMGGLEWLEGDAATAYVNDMLIAQGYAALNRRVIGEVLLGFFGVRSLKALDEEREAGWYIESVHNYIDFKDRVIRKGAIAARAGQPVIVPFNMADGSVIGVGKGNAEWNCSAPHGAGRVMSRRKAKESLDLDYYGKRMREANVWTSCVGKGTLDEAPMAYRRPQRILDVLAETVEIRQVLRPIYNFKAGADE